MSPASIISVDLVAELVSTGGKVMIDRVDELREEGYLNSDTMCKADDFTFERLLKEMPEECESVRRGELVKRTIYNNSKLIEDVLDLASASGLREKLTPAYHRILTDNDVSLNEAEYTFVVDMAKDVLLTGVIDCAGLIRKLDANMLYDFNTDVELLEYVRKTQDHSLVRLEVAKRLLSMCVEYRDVANTDIRLYELMRDSGFFNAYYKEADKYDPHRSCAVALQRFLYDFNSSFDYWDVAEMLCKSGVLMVYDYCHFKQTFDTPIEDMYEGDVTRMVVYCYFMYSHDVIEDIESGTSKLSMCSLRVQHALKRNGYNTDEKVYRLLANGEKVRGLGTAGMQELKEVFTV